MGKKLELLAEAVPKLANVAYIAGSKATRDVAQKLGVSLQHARLSTSINEAEYNRIFSSLQDSPVDGIIIADEVENYTNRFLLLRLIQQARVPAVFDYRDLVEAGGLMAYCWDLKGAYRSS